MIVLYVLGFQSTRNKRKMLLVHLANKYSSYINLDFTYFLVTKPVEYVVYSTHVYLVIVYFMYFLFLDC